MLLLAKTKKISPNLLWPLALFSNPQFFKLVSEPLIVFLFQILMIQILTSVKIIQLNVDQKNLIFSLSSLSFLHYYSGVNFFWTIFLTFNRCYTSNFIVEKTQYRPENEKKNICCIFVYFKWKRQKILLVKIFHFFITQF